MVYSISYDLKTSGRDYNSLIDAIKAYGVWWHQTESVWIIVTEENAPSVRDNLMKYIDQNDQLFVAALKGEWAGVGFTEKEYIWMKSIPTEKWR